MLSDKIQSFPIFQDKITNKRNNKSSEGEVCSEAEPNLKNTKQPEIKSHVYYSKSQQLLSEESDDADSQRKKTRRNQSRIKSISWKRSDKKASYEKSCKSKSPNWVALQQTEILSELCSYGVLSSSECRPGTSYSDVVFGAKSPGSLLNGKSFVEYKNSFEGSSPFVPALVDLQENQKKKLIKITPRSKNSSKGSETEEAFPPLNSKSAVIRGNKIRLNRGKQKESTRKLKILHRERKVNESEDEDTSSLLESCFGSDLEDNQNEEVVSEIECPSDDTKSLSIPSDNSIGQAKCNIFLQKQNGSCDNGDILQYLNSTDKNLRNAADDEEWKYKYLPILNVKLFNDTKDEFGFSYSSYESPRRNFLKFDRGEQVFPRFSRHFDDSRYLELEREATLALERSLHLGS